MTYSVDIFEASLLILKKIMSIFFSSFQLVIIQEVGDDSNVCVLKIFDEVSNLPILLAINLAKVGI